jgi:hypothetical protein
VSDFTGKRLLVPRNLHVLIVGIMARISGCVNQKELSLDDQVDHAKDIIATMYDGPVEYRIIATKGKGERLDRPELDQIRAELLKDELDVLIMEDMGRLVRGVEAVRLFGLAVDHGTRAISPNDRVDTINETWEEDALAACRDHVAHNCHTSRRLKQKLMNRFEKFGGSPGLPIAGYVVPRGVKTYGEWLIDPEATPIIQEGLRRLQSGRNCEAVAEYFNGVMYKGGTGFPTGAFCRRKRWDGKMVRRFYKNRILGGAPGRGFRHTVKRHETGRRVSVVNPEGPKFCNFSQLAHVDLAELDAVNLMLDKVNANLGSGADHRCRRQTRFPAGPARCWYCGRPEVWGGNGVSGNLMCSGAREWRCWCSVGFSGALAADRVMSLIDQRLHELEGFADQFRELVRAAQAGGADLTQRWERLRRDEESLARRERNVKAALAEYGPDPTVKGSLAELVDTRTQLADERRTLESLAARKLLLPEHPLEFRELFRKQFADLARDSREFNDLLRMLVPSFHVHLVRLIDGGHPLPRAKVTLSLDGLSPDAKHVPGLVPLLTFDATIDLFQPPQRAVIREQAVVLTAQGLEQREIAVQLEVTQTAVGDAIALDKLMRGRGLTDPYVLLHAPPDDYPKLRRHRNPKYVFQRVEGHQPPVL